MNPVVYHYADNISYVLIDPIALHYCYYNGVNMKYLAQGLHKCE